MQHIAHPAFSAELYLTHYHNEDIYIVVDKYHDNQAESTITENMEPFLFELKSRFGGVVPENIVCIDSEQCCDIVTHKNGVFNGFKPLLGYEAKEHFFKPQEIARLFILNKDTSGTVQ